MKPICDTVDQASEVLTALWVSITAAPKSAVKPPSITGVAARRRPRGSLEPASFAAAARIAVTTGIPEDNILICATHTHTGPEVRTNSVVGVCEPWLAELPGRLVEAVRKVTYR